MFTTTVIMNMTTKMNVPKNIHTFTGTIKQTIRITICPIYIIAIFTGQSRETIRLLRCGLHFAAFLTP